MTVIGGGVIGAAVTHALAARGVAVALLEAEAELAMAASAWVTATPTTPPPITVTATSPELDKPGSPDRLRLNGAMSAPYSQPRPRRRGSRGDF